MFFCVFVWQDIVKSILLESELSDRRAVTLSIEECLKLLLLFNKRGIHFRNLSGNSGAAKQLEPAEAAVNSEEGIQGETQP